MVDEEKEIKIKLTKPEFTVLLIGVLALKVDLEQHDKDKLSIPSAYIDEVWRKVKELKWENF